MAPVFYYVAYQVYVPYPSISLPVDVQFGRDNASAVVDTTEVASRFANTDYYLSVVLDLPRDSHNSQLGNFMVSTELLTECHSHKRSRFSILPYKSTQLEFLDTALFAPLYLFDFASQSSTIDLEMFDWPRKTTLAPIVVALDRLVNLNSLHLVWHVRWRGVRWFMYKYPVSAFLLGCIFFISIELLSAALVAILILVFFGPQQDEQEQTIFQPPQLIKRVPTPSPPTAEPPKDEQIESVLSSISPPESLTSSYSDSDTETDTETDATSYSARLRGIDILPTPDPEPSPLSSYNESAHSSRSMSTPNTTPYPDFSK
ncbi:hypothetical protein TRICI_004433 [Trichomonascus ciferrii]|uniref:Seipin n=1 Tax=Trichomonascus ciferrii TaxID=44093 RepID=A0A642V110_9ASCO|nr:hypothetical protein TRICI_004433 [Trichomonascus ciferrii]